MKKKIKEKPIAVDLFAGAGGLTRGLRDAGFHVAAAVEVDAAAARTYRWNNRRTTLIEKDISNVTPAEIRKATGGKKISLLAGCAPCQGFCSLTSKNNRVDPRNKLLLVMGELIAELKPETVMMENVPGLVKRGKRIFNQFLRMLQSAGYEHSWKIIQMADYGLPQSRRRLVLLAWRNIEVEFPKQTHSRVKNREERKKLWRTLREAIGGYSAPITLSRAHKIGGPQSADWHVVRDIQAHTKKRLKAANPGTTWLKVRESLRPECHRDGYNGFTNVYGRMAWDKPAPTITGGCTTPCKGRFGHPDKRRYTISVLEAARLQGFPESYQFRSEKIDEVCELIGNAVPPTYAKLVARQVLKAISK